jgi:glycosyltransferase involved in cell wall biosynthesis
LAKTTSDLRHRFHPDLGDATVRAPNTQTLAFEAESRLRGLSGWALIRARNDWFQRHAIAKLTQTANCADGRDCTLFAYSYAANHLFEFARKRNWRTVLGQIDPGLQEEKIVGQLYQGNPEQRASWAPAPAEYWDQWKVECELADQIIVNSEWSRKAVEAEGVSSEKVHVVPLAYENCSQPKAFERRYPPTFSSQRPMRVLFLGQVNLRKGVNHVLDAADLLKEEPVEFWFVGPIQISVPLRFKGHPRFRWIGPTSRSEAAHYYRDADLFMFPSLSDGFGLTQLEAQAWKLPVVASHCCGRVVRHEENGILLDEVSGQTIAGVLLNFLRNPSLLAEMSDQSYLDPKFTLDSLASSLINL